MNKLTLAVAGGRKTEGIVTSCKGADTGKNILVLTYTQNNQREIANRIDRLRPLEASVEVQGWFAFLLGECVRPYLPLKFPGRRLTGLNFDGDPGRVAGQARFLDSEGRAYRRHLSRLAYEVCVASNGAVIDRLSRIYDEIHIDEAQDFNGYDLDVLLLLLKSKIQINLVGDVRQALFNTNVFDQRRKGLKGSQIKTWFDQQKTAGLLEIEHSNVTWRSNQAIASLADTAFDETWGFPPTVSRNTTETGHDGVFVIDPKDAEAYLSEFSPVCLRYSSNSAKHLDLPFMNIGVSKGLTRDRVLIAPTAHMDSFIRTGRKLEKTTACSFYVAVTRAKYSVAFVVSNPHKYPLQTWTP